MERKRCDCFGKSCLVFFILFLFSCSKTPEQYRTFPPIKPHPGPVKLAGLPSSEPTREEGGLLLNEKADLKEEEKDVRTRQNTLKRIDYRSGGVAGIHFKTTSFGNMF